MLVHMGHGFPNDPALLWGSPSGIHCTLIGQGPLKPFIIMILDGADIIKRLTFERGDDASAFAIWSMRADAGRFSIEGVPGTADLPDSSSSPST
jgi:hypothetical protein